jgi:hypothetical protein
MEKREALQLITDAAVLFVLITGAFSLLEKLCDFLVTQYSGIVFQRHGLWLIVTAGIIAVLLLYNRKLNHSFYGIIGDPTVRLIAGVFVALEGLINLANLLPVYIMNIKSVLSFPKTAAPFGTNQRLIAYYIISAAILLCRIFAGVYLGKFYKRGKISM